MFIEGSSAHFNSISEIILSKIKGLPYKYVKKLKDDLLNLSIVWTIARALWLTEGFRRFLEVISAALGGFIICPLIGKDNLIKKL